ncbi:MAG: preprotein translocase subunit SecG [Sedimentisphaerales bacterium]|nr:preprotein translocase subunit SecG [Sedimentisphaerales bacterium]
MNLVMLGVAESTIPWWVQALAVLFVIVCLLLIVIVLLQKGRGGGLSAAFGGAGGQSAFGSKTGDVFTWATIVIVGVFLVLSMVLTVVYKPYLSEIDRTPGIGSDSPVPTTTTQPATTVPEIPTAPATEAPAADSSGGAAVPADPSGGAATGNEAAPDNPGEGSGPNP